MTPELITKYARPVPRYTSYPTSPHFNDKIGAADYGEWLDDLGAKSRLSLYAHIPFCDTLCWFCGCNTRLVKRYDPVQRYLRALNREIETVSASLRDDHSVCHLHWGGGSPDILSPGDVLRTAEALKSCFHLATDAEFAVEVDPRGFAREDAGLEKVMAFVDAGVTRISIGVQDFDPRVQTAINRTQSFEQTRWVADSFRERGVEAINIDLIYGLPLQTQESIAQTVEQVILLKPGRVALFGYAHLPSRLKRQRMIDDDTLPNIFDRFAQAHSVGNRLMEHGYERIGLDHFALASDSLAVATRKGRLRRNFQGYTTDNADALIALGASAIGELPQGFVQNATPTGQYESLIESQGLATVRGYRLEAADRVRSFAIQKLMCDLEFSQTALSERFGQDAQPLIEEALALAANDDDGLIQPDEKGFRVTERGRPFLRSICARFDAHLQRSQALHSTGV